MPAEKPAVSREEQEAVRRSFRDVMAALDAPLEALREKGYKVQAEANESEESVTLTVVVHAKWNEAT